VRSEYHSFDVVALSDVFEHVAEPIALLRTAARYLKASGVLYVKVPNARWNLLKQRSLSLLRRSPMASVWDSYEHLVHYTDATLVKMLEVGGFSPIRLTIAKPVQIPAWHQHVGQYYQYPSPWILDWRKHLGRSLFYGLARLDPRIKLGRIGGFAPNIVALARARSVRPGSGSTHPQFAR
jgi:SAM-dependent methyltransferase